MESSRIIVKGLPLGSSTAAVRAAVAAATCGSVTDVRLMTTASGKSRGFAFVGFDTPAAAQGAQKKLHRSYMGAARLAVELARPREGGGEGGPPKKRQRREANKPKAAAAAAVAEPAEEMSDMDFLRASSAAAAPADAAAAPADDGPDDDDDDDNGARLFVRNLPFNCTEDALRAHVAPLGAVSEVHLPIDKGSRKGVGFGFVTLMLPEAAASAVQKLDGKPFQGRLLHVMIAKAAPKPDADAAGARPLSFKEKKEADRRKAAGDGTGWLAGHVSADAVAASLADRYGVSKADVLGGTGAGSGAVTLALGETQLVSENRA